jgi:hypothetical protein
VFGGTVPEGMADLIYLMNTLIDKVNASDNNKDQGRDSPICKNYF